MDELDALLAKIGGTSLRWRGDRQGAELVIAHPIQRHGLFVRDGGVIDLFSSDRHVLGIGPGYAYWRTVTLTIEADSTTLHSSSVDVNAATFGWNGNYLHPHAFSGDRFARFWQDARVLIKAGSMQQEQDRRDGRDQPATEIYQPKDGPTMEFVPLSWLLEPHPLTVRADSEVADRVARTLLQLFNQLEEASRP